jgi:3-hydroxyisobutyrate dehydrogenase
MTQQMSSNKPRIGFIGLGVMGRPMVGNLLKAGFACTVYDIDPRPVEMLVAQGAQSADSARAVAVASDIFVTMVVNDAQFQATLFAPGNAAQALKPGTIVIGMSTMSIKAVREATERLAEQGVQYLDAPVSGGEPGATQGTLSIMVGGPTALLEQCSLLLSTLGSNIYHVGEQAGSGQAVKMINQLMVCVHNAIVAEALTFGEKVGLDKAMLLEVISKSAGNSWILSDRGPRMVSEQFSPPKSALNILVKDLGFVIDTANSMGYPLLLGTATHQIYKMAHLKGWGQLDDSILKKLMEEISGLEES